MRKLISFLSTVTSWLCQIFEVTPESITPKEERRGNLPPPSGGIASY
jgi:hypothetical protein